MSAEDSDALVKTQWGRGGGWTPPGSEEQELALMCQKRRILSKNLEKESTKKKYNEVRRSADQ